MPVFRRSRRFLLGSVALGGWDATFDGLKVGYDNNSDGDIGDPSDYVVIDEDFSGSTVSPTYDYAGNLRQDADYAYYYDAWNNLAVVKAQNAGDVVVAQYGFYANDQRSKKAVTNRGDLDATTYFYYDGSEVIEERDGSDELYQQYVWGPNHIDELAITFGANGTTFAYADANWNVMGLTTVAGDLAEEYNYTPYGRLQTWRHTSPLDVDGDGDFDITDYGAVHTAYYGGQQAYNRLCDFDSDGDVDIFDMSVALLTYYEPGDSTVVANRDHSATGNPYTYTCRRHDPETGLLHYRARAYNPSLKMFMQRDPLGRVNGPNLYYFVFGNPLRYLDPYGLSGNETYEEALSEFGPERREQVTSELGDLGESINGGLWVLSAANPLMSIYEIATGETYDGQELSLVDWGMNVLSFVPLGPFNRVIKAGGSWIWEGVIRTRGGITTKVQAVGRTLDEVLAAISRAARKLDADAAAKKASQKIVKRTPTDKLAQHTSVRDLVGAAREVKTGRPHGGQHVKEVREAARGLRRRVRALQRQLDNPNLTSQQRRDIIRELRKASRNLDGAEAALKGVHRRHCRD